MREDEFEFLGMAPPRNDTKAHALEEMKKHRDRRQKMQVDADDVYEKALKEQLEFVHKKKGADIKADLLEERRQWILDYRQDPAKGNKFPAEFDDFYNQFDKAEDGEEGEKGKMEIREARVALSRKRTYRRQAPPRLCSNSSSRSTSIQRHGRIEMRATILISATT